MCKHLAIWPLFSRLLFSWLLFSRLLFSRPGSGLSPARPPLMQRYPALLNDGGFLQRVSELLSEEPGPPPLWCCCLHRAPAGPASALFFPGSAIGKVAFCPSVPALISPVVDAGGLFTSSSGPNDRNQAALESFTRLFFIQTSEAPEGSRRGCC